MKTKMSAFGTKRTCLFALHMSAFGGKADIKLKPHSVCLPMTALVRQRVAELVCSATVIIIISGSGDDDDANSGDEGNTRRRGSHDSS